MNSKIIKLPDLSGMEINPDLLSYSVSDEEIDAMVSGMMRNLGETVEAETVCENCGLICQGNAGIVYLYPDLAMPGIEIKTDLSSLKKGDTLNVHIHGEEVSLTLDKILVNAACSEEKIAEKAAIPGVSTIDDLKAHLKEKEENKNRENNIRMHIMAMHDYLAANAEVELDEEEISSWAMAQAKISYEENLAMGIDLRFTEEGDMITEEEALEMLAKDMRPQFISILADQKFAEDHGFTVDEASIQETTLSQLKEAGITDEKAIAENVSMAIANEYFRLVYETLKTKAEEDIQ